MRTPVDALTERDAALRSAERENETLYAVIKTVSSSLDLDRVLRAGVDLYCVKPATFPCLIQTLKQILDDWRLLP